MFYDVLLDITFNIVLLLLLSELDQMFSDAFCHVMFRILTNYQIHSFPNCLIRFHLW